MLTPSTTQAIGKIKRLDKLTREIRSDYDALQVMVERTRKSCNEVIAETILLGNKLIEAKSLVRHGQWEEWLSKNCSQISEKTAQRYMRLSKTTHVSLLEN